MLNVYDVELGEGTKEGLGMVDHTWFRGDRTSHCQLQCQDRITIPVAYPVASAIESPNVILRRRGPCEVCRRWCASWHLRGLICIQRLLGRKGRLLVAWMAAYVISCRWRLGVGLWRVLLLLLIRRRSVLWRRLKRRSMAVVGVLLLWWGRWRV